MTELKKEFESKFVMMTGYQMILLKDEVEELFDWIEQKIDEAWAKGYNEAVETHARITQVQLDEACKKQREICADVYLKEKGYLVQNTTISFAIKNAPSPKENGVASEFLCECKKQKGWISENQETNSCPNCGRKYIGRYNEKNLTIDAIQISPEEKL